MSVPTSAGASYDRVWSLALQLFIQNKTYIQQLQSRDLDDDRQNYPQLIADITDFLISREVGRPFHSKTLRRMISSRAK